MSDEKREAEKGLLTVYRFLADCDALDTDIQRAWIKLCEAVDQADLNGGKAVTE